MCIRDRLGWTAVTGTLDPNALILFLIIFAWTPPHFWALALYREGDYVAAGVPMLPVVRGGAATKRQMLLYTLLLAPLSLTPCFLGMTGWSLYGSAAVILNAIFLVLAVAVMRDTTEASAKRMFGFSIFYLFALFAVLIADNSLSGML